MFILSDPVVMIGGGEYNLNDIKDIKTTESYLGLDQDTRECQNKEHHYNCTTRQYVDTILGQCGCLPLSIKLSNEVSYISKFKCWYFS